MSGRFQRLVYLSAVLLILVSSLASIYPKPHLIGPTRLYVDGDVSTGANDGSSWANAYHHLQDALDRANNNGFDGFVIWVAEGVYYPDEDSVSTYVVHANDDIYEDFWITYDNVRMYGGFAGDETSLDQRDWKNNPTILSGDVDGDDDNGDGNFIAEATQNHNGSNSLHVLFLNGDTNGAITSNTVIDGFIITAGSARNAGTSGYGGGLYCYAAAAASVCSPTLRNLKFQGNYATLGGGMMLYSENGGISSPSLTSVEFNNNFAADGGGGFFAYVGSLGSGTESMTDMVNVKFISNRTNGSGGGIYLDCTAGTGGYILTNVEFYKNDAVGGGGAINTHSRGGNVNITINNSTFTKNEANSGGALLNKKDTGPQTFSVEINNSILWGDIGLSSDPEILNDSVVPGITASDIEGSFSGGGVWVSSIGTNNGGNLNVDPAFEDATTGDLSLLSSSPVIDAGRKSLLPIDVTDLDGDYDYGEQLPLDLLLNHRLELTEVDMGAYEFGPLYDNVGFYMPSGMKWYLKESQTTGWGDVISFKFGGPTGWQAVAGDWDNDGVDTVGLYVPSTGKWYLKNSLTAGWTDYIPVKFKGVSGAIPVAGDWNNDGQDTIGFYVPSGKKWYLKNNLVNGWGAVTPVKFGGPSDWQPVTGDWNDDGIDSIGFYVPASGKWYLKDTLADGWFDYIAVKFKGVSGSVAVAGNWDWNGGDTIGFHVPTPKKWYLKNDLSDGWGSVIAFKFGGPTDWQPVTGDWK